MAVVEPTIDSGRHYWHKQDSLKMAHNFKSRPSLLIHAFIIMQMQMEYEGCDSVGVQYTGAIPINYVLAEWLMRHKLLTELNTQTYHFT